MLTSTLCIDKSIHISKERSHKMHRATLTITETAKRLGIGRSAAYEAARTGQIPTIKIGKRILVPLTALERLLSGE
jgi:excisionase family DNA binding protein